MYILMDRYTESTESSDYEGTITVNRVVLKFTAKLKFNTRKISCNFALRLWFFFASTEGDINNKRLLSLTEQHAGVL